MTISSETNKSGPYTENGVADTFAYEFKIENESHIKVVRAISGVETVLTLTTDYTVTGVGNAIGGNVIINAPVSGSTLTLVLDVPFTQGLELENQGAYFAESIEAALDLAAQRDKQLQEQISRAVLVQVSDAQTDPADLIASLKDNAAAASSDAAAAAASAISSASYATAASVSETAAAASALGAAASETAAAASALGAAASETAAAASAVTAAAAQAVVEPIAADITTVAANIADIQNAEGNANAAALSAANALASENAVALAGVPVGRIVMRFGAVDPGYIAWGEGGTFDRTVYPALAAWLDANGASLGLDAGQIAAGTIPDWRDYSPRTAGGALGPAVGAKQGDQVGPHDHWLKYGNNTWADHFAGSAADYGHGAGATSDTYKVAATGTGIGAETRVKSFGVRWQIKAYGALINQGTADLVAIENAYTTLSNAAVRDDVDQNAQAKATISKVNILKNTLQAWEAVPGGVGELSVPTASIDVTGLSAYRLLRISGAFRLDTAASNLSLRVSSDNGATFLVTGYDYQILYSSGTPADTEAINAAAWPMNVAGSVIGSPIVFDALISDFNTTVSRSAITAHVGWINSGGSLATSLPGGRHTAAVAFNALRIVPSSGLLAAGSYVVEGLRG